MLQQDLYPFRERERLPQREWKRLGGIGDGQ